MFFFAVSGLYTFLLPTLCLRFAYAIAASTYAGPLCLDLPTRAYAYHLILDFAYVACIWCFCGVCVLSCLFMFCLRGSRRLREACAMPTRSLRDERGTNVDFHLPCLFMSVCLFVCFLFCLPSFPSLPSFASFPSISYLEHSLRS